jgi:hypothetical protein
VSGQLHRERGGSPTDYSRAFIRSATLDWERNLATWRMRLKRHWTHCMSYWLLDALYVLLAFLVDRWRSAQACSTRGLTSFAIHSFSLRRQTPRSVDAPISSQCATSSGRT